MTAPTRRNDRNLSLCREVAGIAQRKAEEINRSLSAYVTELVMLDGVPAACRNGRLEKLTCDELRDAVGKLTPPQWGIEPHPGPLIEDSMGNVTDPKGQFVRLDAGGPFGLCCIADCDEVKSFAKRLRQVASDGGTATLKNAFPDADGFPDLVARRRGNGVVFRYEGETELLSSVSRQFIPIAALALECAAVLSLKTEGTSS